MTKKHFEAVARGLYQAKAGMDTIKSVARRSSHLIQPLTKLGLSWRVRTPRYTRHLLKKN